MIADLIDQQWFTLLWTPFTAILGIGLFAVTAIFSWITVQRSNFSPGMIFLEFLRLLMVGMVAFTLNQPEWLQQFMPDEDPVLVVLWDESESMNTMDVTVDGEMDAKSRVEWIQPMLEDAIWEPFEENVKVELEPFSSDLRFMEEEDKRFSDEQRLKASDINSALANINEKYRNLRGIVLLSDGSWNYGESPTRAATQLRMKDVPIYSVVVGSDSPLPDISIHSLDAPTKGTARKPTRIPFSIKSTMPRDISVVASLTSSDGDEMTASIVVPANGVLSDSFTWRPKKKGEYTLTLTVPKQDDELIGDNNELSVPITIDEKPITVLVIESFPRWEYRYLRNALSRDPGVVVKCLLFHPNLPKVGGGKDYIEKFPTKEELSEFDVIFLGDVGVGDDQLTLEQCRLMKGLVESASSGLIFMPGFRGRHFSLMETELADLYPVHLDAGQVRGWGSQVPDQFQLTELGRESLLTKLADTPEANAAVWRGLPGFQWFAPVSRAKLGSQVLAVHAKEVNESGRIPLLVTKTYGTGKILFMGTDGAWRWREGVEDKYHYRFWGQVARWMAYQRNLSKGTGVNMYFQPERPKVGDLVTIYANVASVTGEPLRDGTVNVQVVAPSGNTDTLNLTSKTSDDEWGLFSNSFVPKEDGLHQLILTCRETGTTHDDVIDIQGSKREKLGQPANFDVMEEVATITRGKMVTTDDFQEILKTIGELEEPEPRMKRLRLWAHPAWAGSLVLLLGIFWSGRKLVGKI